MDGAASLLKVPAAAPRCGRAAAVPGRCCFKPATGAGPYGTLLCLLTGELLIGTVPIARRSPQSEQAHHETGAAGEMGRTAGFCLRPQRFSPIQGLLGTGHHGAALPQPRNGTVRSLLGREQTGLRGG